MADGPQIPIRCRHRPEAPGGGSPRAALRHPADPHRHDHSGTGRYELAARDTHRRCRSAVAFAPKACWLGAPIRQRSSSSPGNCIPGSSRISLASQRRPPLQGRVSPAANGPITRRSAPPTPDRASAVRARAGNCFAQLLDSRRRRQPGRGAEHPADEPDGGVLVCEWIDAVDEHGR